MPRTTGRFSKKSINIMVHDKCYDMIICLMGPIIIMILTYTTIFYTTELITITAFGIVYCFLDSFFLFPIVLIYFSHST